MTRIDVELLRLGMAASRSEAYRMIRSKSVTVNGAIAEKPARIVRKGDVVDVIRPLRFVSRGGDKLLAAIKRFPVDVAGKNCIDVGASTGGFTDCLLQHGASHVAAVDVGRNLLHESLLADSRVISHDNINIRFASPSDFGDPVDIVTADVSFISLRTVMPQLAELVKPDGDLIALVKPQFESTKEEASRGRGIIRSPEIWYRVLTEVFEAAESCGLTVLDAIPAPAPKLNANQEFLMHSRRESDREESDTTVQPLGRTPKQSQQDARPENTASFTARSKAAARGESQHDARSENTASVKSAALAHSAVEAVVQHL